MSIGREGAISIFSETSRGLLPPHPLHSNKGNVEAREEGSYLDYPEFLSSLFPPVEVWKMGVSYRSSINKKNMSTYKYNTGQSVLSSMVQMQR